MTRGVAIRACAGFALFASLHAQALWDPSGQPMDFATAVFERVPIEGYASPFSVKPGDTLHLCLSSRFASVDIEILTADTNTPVARFRDVPAVHQDVPPDAHANGCRWNATWEFAIPRDWRSSVYIARVTSRDASSETFANIPFVLREEDPGSTSRILSLYPHCTVQAYNTYGGASVYPTMYGPPSPCVAFDRPIDPRGPGGIQWLPTFASWLRREHWEVAYASDRDLQDHPTLLDAYDLLLLTGHHEYWTYPMRDAVDAFVGNGGRVLVLAGNTCFIQVRFERDGKSMRCHKVPYQDAFYASEDVTRRRQVTTAFALEPLLDPPDRTFGLGYRHAQWTAPIGVPCRPGPFGGDVPCYPYMDGFGYYRIHAPRFAPFRELGLDAGTLFGIRPYVLAGRPVNVISMSGECDGASIEVLDGHVVASHVAGAPSNLICLATSPAMQGAAAFSTHEDFGQVVNAGNCTYATLPHGQVDGYSIPEVEALTHLLLRQLGRPRRSPLRNGGLECWHEGTPRGWDIQGTVLRGGALASGRYGAVVPSGSSGALRMALAPHAARSIGFFSRHDERELIVSLTSRVTGDEIGHWSFGKAGDAHRLVALEPDMTATETWLTFAFPRGSGEGRLDQVETFTTDPTWAATPSELSSCGMTRARLGTLPGGSRLVVTWDGEASDDSSLLVYRVDGGDVARWSIASGRRSIRWTIEDRSSGRFVEPEIVLHSPGDGWARIANLRVFPTGAASPGPARRVRDGGFETPSEGAWTIRGEGSAERVPEGAWGQGMKLRAGDGGLSLEQGLRPRAEPEGERHLLSCWMKTNSKEVRLEVIVDEGVRATAVAHGEDRWHAVQVEFDASPRELDRARLVCHVPAGHEVLLDEVRLRATREILAQDFLGNGAFEFVPLPAEIEHGTDWSASVPAWIVSSREHVGIDARRAYSGSHSLRLSADAETTWAYRMVADSLRTDRPWRLRAKVYAERRDAFDLVLQMWEPHAGEAIEIGRVRNRAEHTWETLEVDVPPGVCASHTSCAAVQAFLRLELAGARAWLDEITLVTDPDEP
ncbi:MAG: hypothetical protein H6834_09480 [Planctomycetes bacterium]|nr:hypothetical protein [Planctomycetota bacterium]